MPLDHYVSQVHLRNFYSPETEHLRVIRKSDLKRFPARSDHVCRIEDGSTNAYLQKDRAVEDFLCGIEPKYNAALAKLRVGQIDQECIYTVAGFAAYVTCCTPTAMRIHTEPLKAALEATAIILDRRGKFGPAPAALGGKSLTELLAEGTVHFNVDKKYPQALGISSIINRLSIWGNSRWEILQNGEVDAQFFTSDFPAAIEVRPDGVVNRLVPLAPDLAIRIIPNVGLARAKPDLSFPGFKFRSRKLDKAEAVEINRLIVQCAEDLVFFRDERDWIEGFVAKHKRCRVETVTDRIPRGTGFITVPRQRIIERRAA